MTNRDASLLHLVLHHWVMLWGTDYPSVPHNYINVFCFNLNPCISFLTILNYSGLAGMVNK